MKKAVKIILCVVAVLLAGSIITVSAAYVARGSLNGQALSQEFQAGIQAEDGALADGANVRVMSANLLVHYASWGGEPAKPRAKMFVELLNTYRPAVVGLQEVSGEWFCCLNRNMPDGYKFLYPFETCVFVHMTSMIYNENLVNLIEKGDMTYSQGDNPRLRRVEWGLFETRDTGKRFVVTSTHFDLIRENQEEAEFAVMSSQTDEMVQLVGELAEKYNCPVFSTGDFNAMEDGRNHGIYDAPDIYQKLAGQLTDTKYTAAQKLAGDAQAITEPVYDHIFLKGTADIFVYRILSEAYMTPLSDHYPIFVDVAV